MGFFSPSLLLGIFFFLFLNCLQGNKISSTKATILAKNPAIKRAIIGKTKATLTC
jgi:hypothetical protein